MASDGKVVFPVRFDLDSAVREATGDADRVLKRLGVMIASRPLKLGVEITPPKGGWDKKLGNIADGSINAMRKEMRKLVEEWNKLSEAQRITNQQTGAYTAEATKILNRYSQLVAASESYARGLEQIAAAARKSADAELKASRETAAKHEERRKILAAEETSISAVAAKMKVFQEIANKYDFGTKAYRYATAQLERLGAQYQRLTAIMNSNTGNKGKDIIGAENLKATLRGAENSIESVKAKLKALDLIISKTPQDSFGFRRAQREAIRLLGILRQLQSNMPKPLSIRQQARSAQKSILLSQSKDIDTLTRKLQYYQNLLNRIDFNAKPQTFTAIAKEVERLTGELDKARNRMAQLTGQSTSGSSTQARNARKVNEEYTKQLGYVDRLIRRMAVYGSISMIGGFLTKVREVTAQFELQRVSLGAILQDQNKANQLFSEIKSFALKSPVSILDLTKYTKQLAAYKIGYDELFETTKKLTDVSVGLGVSMDRVVLAYGQVRATGHLRASEIRQFTEMGVPIVEELAAKISKMNGELVTAADVMDMVSKRAISFELVKEVFDDMTSAGGAFYNMQEKQGNTLYGLWAKLGDAASVMYEEIGSTGAVNAAMKSIISLATSAMKNWRLLAGEIAVATIGFLAYKTVQNLSNISIATSTKATQRLMAAKVQLIAAQNRLTAAKRLGNKAAVRSAETSILEAQWTVKAAAANRLAANATNVWTAAKYRLIAATSQLKAAMAGNWIMLTVAAVAAIGVAIGNAIEKATRLKRTLDEIEVSTISLQNQSVGRFEHLAEAAVNAANGSKKQRDALAELSRTYGDILPQDTLKLENLRAMNHRYGELTTSLKEYIALQQKNKGMEEISAEYGGKINEASKQAIESLVKYAKVERNVAINIVGEMQREIQENLEKGIIDPRTAGQQLKEVAREFGVEIDDIITTYAWHDNWYDHLGLGKATNEFVALRDAISGQYTALDEWNKRVDASTGTTGEWLQILEKAKEKIESVRYVMRDTQGNTSAIDENTFLYQQMRANATMKIVADLINNDTSINEAIKNKEVEWNDGWIHLVSSVDPKNLMDITTINFDAIIEALSKKHPELAEKIKDIQKEWGNVAPTNPTVVQIRQKFFDIAASFGIHVDKMKKYLWDGSNSVDDYLKRLKEQQEELKARLKEKEQTLLNMGTISKWWNKLLGNDIEADINQMKKEIKALDEVIPYVTDYTIPKDKKKRGSQSDTRLQTLQEINQTLEKINKEYDDLRKKEGKTKAFEDIKKQFADTLSYTNKLGKKFGLQFNYPTEFKSLQQYRSEILKVMKSLKNLKGGEKAILEFETMIGKADSDELQKQIEQQLKDLQEKISRTKTAKEFYEKILKSTGDASLALNLTTSIYGEDGQDLKKQAAEQVRRIFSEWKIDMPLGIVDESDNIDYKALREFAKKAKGTRAIGEDVADELIQIAENGEKELSRVAQEGAKLLLKYDEIAQQRVNIEQEASEKIKTLRDAEALYLASNTSAEQKAVYSKRTNKAVTGVEADRDLKLLKLQDEYMRFFSAIHSLTNKEAENLRRKVRDALYKAFQNGAISADELKRELKAVDEQFQKLIEDSGIAMDYLKGGFDGLIKRVRETADELQSVAAEISKMEDSSQISEGQKNFIDKILGKFGDKSTGSNFAELFSKTNGDLKQMGSLLGGVSDKMGGLANNSAGALAVIDMIIKSVDSTIRGIAQIRDQLNEMRSEDNQLGGGFWDAFEYLENFNKYAASGWEKLKSGDVIGAAADTVSSIISIFGTAQAHRVRKANKEIKRQQELLDQLEYTYGRLEKAAEKAFGTDYVNNYQQQIKNLQAQQTAYLKQAEAERSKGKKKDKEKIKEYEEQARETADKIKELQEELVAHFTGQNRADAARQMAQSWIEARASMSDTFAAIKGDYQDLIKNMIVEGAAARVIENALSPVWDSMEKMLAKNDVDGAIDSLINGMDAALTQANNGMEVLWKALEARGYDMKQLVGDVDTNYTGIAKTVSGATSEEINAVAAIGNTLMYYVSPIPRIDENLAAIRTIMERGGSTSSAVAGTTIAVKDYTDMFTTANQHLSNLPTMERHLSEIRNMLSRIITTEGRYSGVNTFLRK